MYLLTPYLTVLRGRVADRALIHAPVWPPQADSIDFPVNLPLEIGDGVELDGLPGFLVQQGARPRLLRLRRGDDILWIHPADPRALTRPARLGDFELLVVSEAELATLRQLFSHAWQREISTGPVDVTPLQVKTLPAESFLLELGELRVDLSRAMPRGLEDADGVARGERYEFVAGGTMIVLACSGDARHEILLRRVPPYRQPAEASAAEFQEFSDRSLHLKGKEEIVTLPITARDADTAWLYKNPEGDADQVVGRCCFTPIVMRATEKYVLLARHVEGMVFDENGVLNETGYLDGIGSGGARHLPLLPGMRQEGERLFLDREALDAAPFLPGANVVFYGGTLSNYTHWLIDGMLPLHVLLPYVPPDAKLLLPATLRALREDPRRFCDHHDIMRAFGFADLPAVEIDAPYCRVEEVYWLENGWMHNMPAELIQGLRARVADLHPAPAGGEVNIFIARRGTRRVANGDAVEHFLSRHGFETHYFDAMSVDRQIDLFMRANWVIGPHGAELGNLLFCRAGTKVLELAPDSGYKPYYSYMCNKLGLTHGILPCPTDDGGFHGDLTVDMHRFTALFRMLKHRL